MQVLRLLSFKSFIWSLVILLVLGLAPEALHSQTGTPHAAKTPPAAAKTAGPASTSSASRSPSKSSSSNKPSAEALSKPEGHQSSNSLQEELSQIKRPSLITQGVLLALMSLLPFIIMVLTSFLKVVVVLSLLRSALGVQQAPPNQVINGVAFMLSLFIMYPTGIKMYDAAQTVMARQAAPDSILSPDSSTYVIEVAAAASEPFKEFMKRNSSGRHQALFYRLAYRGLPDDIRATLKPDSFIVLVPSDITGQLKDAFEIGVLIYIPFFVIDLVTSNILLAMGMMMLSPVTISMPLKLFLLVMLDGWTILIEGLVKTFQ